MHNLDQFQNLQARKQINRWRLQKTKLGKCFLAQIANVFARNNQWIAHFDCAAKHKGKAIKAYLLFDMQNFWPMLRSGRKKELYNKHITRIIDQNRFWSDAPNYGSL